MSIVRVGLAETKHFAEGYEAIFGKKKKASTEKPNKRKPRAKLAKPVAKARAAKTKKTKKG